MWRFFCDTQLPQKKLHITQHTHKKLVTCIICPNTCVERCPSSPTKYVVNHMQVTPDMPAHWMFAMALSGLPSWA